MDFKKYLEKGARQVDQELEKILSQFLNDVKNTNTKLIPFALGLINSCKGGKRIRGVLVKLGYEIATVRQGGPRNDVVWIGAAFEILHAGLLIHDDIMDKSLTRRGQPSLYQALSRPKDGRVAGDHYGVSQAINIGDISLYLPIKIITESNFLGDIKIKALNHLSQIIINTGWGQVLDVELGERVKGKGESEKDIKFININKTAKYTIAGPLQIGAILGGADERVVRELGVFGENAGVAFQIQDDILDREAVSADQAKSKALKYTLEAKKVIPKITKDEKMRKLLEEMVDYLVERDK